MTMPDLIPKKEAVEKAIDFAYENLVPGLTKFAVLALNLQILGDSVAFASHVFQRRRSIGFVRALAKEWKSACDEHRVKAEYLETEEGQVSLQELFDYLDKDLPNEEKFKVMKSIFFHGAEVYKTGKKVSNSSYFIRLCRKLDPEELLILSVCYKAFLDGRGRNNIAADQWAGLVAEYSDGLVPKGLIEFYEQPMIDHRLIGARTHSDKSGIAYSEHFRLTALGIQLSEFIKGN